MDVEGVLRDLIAEQDDLDAIVATLSGSDWSRPTPSPGWTIADQIAHLAYFDASAVLAIGDPQGFAAEVARIVAAMGSGDLDDVTLGGLRTLSPARLVATWRFNRRELAMAAAGLGDGSRVSWYGPPMGAKSFLSARLMETWAHGQDIVDTVGAVRQPTGRLRHIAQLGYITRAWSYTNRGLAPPQQDIHLVLAGPDGASWVWGPDDAAETVSGDAEEFCLIVTQRRHVDDTQLVTGPLGLEWLLMAQAFAGPATNGPAPRG